MHFARTRRAHEGSLGLQGHLRYDQDSGFSLGLGARVGFFVSTPLKDSIGVTTN